MGNSIVRRGSSVLDVATKPVVGFTIAGCVCAFNRQTHFLQEIRLYSVPG
jgi:hypothetical protein